VAASRPSLSQDFYWQAPAGLPAHPEKHRQPVNRAPSKRTCFPDKNTILKKYSLLKFI